MLWPDSTSRTASCLNTSVYRARVAFIIIFPFADSQLRDTFRGGKIKVYWGGWKSVDVKDLKWESNSTLNLRHDSPMYLCESSRRVKVICLERPSLPVPPSAQ